MAFKAEELTDPDLPRRAADGIGWRLPGRQPPSRTGPAPRRQPSSMPGGRIGGHSPRPNTVPRQEARLRSKPRTFALLRSQLREPDGRALRRRAF